MNGDQPYKGTMSLADFAPSEWFKESSSSTFMMRIYASLGLPHEKWIAEIESAKNHYPLEKPVALAFGIIGDLDMIEFKSYQYSNPDGMTVWDLEIGESKLKKSSYVILMTPKKIDGIDEKEFDAKRRLDFVVCIIRAHIGMNFLRDLVFEAEVKADPKAEKPYRVPGPPHKVPQFPEGPYLNENNWEQIGEIISAIPRLSKENRARIELALDFFQKALESEEHFFYYWTALEILCNGRAPAIREKLHRCYPSVALHEIDEATGLLQIKNWRHDFFHKGKRPLLIADIERYIQLMFLDLLRQEIGLQIVGHIASLQKAVGYNLSEIGLPDNRTAEQKERAGH